MLNEKIDKEALKTAIQINTGWNFMCPAKNVDEIQHYLKTGDFDSMSPATLYQLNGIYKYIAQDYEWMTGKYLPNIFVTEENI